MESVNEREVNSYITQETFSNRTTVGLPKDEQAASCLWPYK